MKELTLDQIEKFDVYRKSFPTNFQVTLPNGGYFYYGNAVGNCKHFYVDYVTQVLGGDDGLNLFKSSISYIAQKASKITFSVNVTTYTFIEKIQKHFKMISCVAVPTGYTEGFQFHAIFFTNENVRNRQHYVTRFIKNGLGDLTVPKVRVGERIPEPDGKLHNFTKEHKEKILSYKSKTWLKKYLDKLIS